MQKRSPARSAPGLPQEGARPSPDADLPEPIAADVGAENPLSEREMEVSRLLVTGATNTEIARELTISPHTVKVHLRNVFEKLQVSSRTEASMVLVQRGWILVPGVETGAPGHELQNGDVQAVPEPAVPELPPPIVSRPQPVAWQRIYMILVPALCLVLALIPYLISRSEPPFTLLSDAGQTAIGKPTVELLNRWDARTPLGQARSRMAVVMDQQWIYVIGGEGPGGRLLQSVDAYSLQSAQWESLAPLPYPLTNSTAILAGDAIYLAGGTTSTENGLEMDGAIAHPATLDAADALLRFDLARGEWQRVGALPVALAGAQLVVQQETLYLLGGWDGTQLRDEVWSLPLAALAPGPEGSSASIAPVESEAWRMVTRMPQAMAFFGAAWAEGALYIAGGYDGQNELDTLYVYRPAPAGNPGGGGNWETLATLGTPRSGLTLAYDGVALLALGGGRTRIISDHERFDTLANQWTTFASPISGEWRHLAAVSRDGVIHLLGGWSGDYLDVHLQYQSSFRALLPIITSD